VSVEYWGIEMAEGILHDFEGWVVFMGCIAILLLEMFILVNVGKDRKKLADAFGIEFPPPTSISTQKQYRSIPKPFIVVFIILMTFSLSIIGMPERKDIIPERQQYSSFPMQLGEWSGKAGIMEQDIIDTLGLDDYIMADYSNSQNQDSVNFYSGYYSVQRSNKVPHSPKRCIPGGGWQISSIDRYEVQGVKINDNKLFVNRLIIRKGEQSQLVYYWFQQRHRVITNEYLVKWYLLIDSIFDRRTDGALMRLITFVDQNDSFEEADQRLTDFASKISPIVAEYVPD
ncbi:MAG: hypothetical protein QG652_97, partial [Pseudomonadota bacterium]|nr:hypothetical protein [Pseudomonadota bacterium]